MTESVVLYVESSWSSPWQCTVVVALHEKGVSYTTALSMLRAGAGVIDHMHERTLTGTAPVLQHGTFWLAESLAIIEYIEEVWPAPRVLPAAVRDRARARQLMTWMRNEHGPLRRERNSELIFYPARHGALAPLSPAALRCVDDLVRVATKLGADGRGFVFDAFGVIDAELAFALMRVVATGHALPPAIEAYVRAVWERPSMRAFADHARPPNPPMNG